MRRGSHVVFHKDARDVENGLHGGQGYHLAVLANDVVVARPHDGKVGGVVELLVGHNLDTLGHLVRQGEVCGELAVGNTPHA